MSEQKRHYITSRQQMYDDDCNLHGNLFHIIIAVIDNQIIASISSLLLIMYIFPGKGEMSNPAYAVVSVKDDDFI